MSIETKECNIKALNSRYGASIAPGLNICDPARLARYQLDMSIGSSALDFGVDLTGFAAWMSGALEQKNVEVGFATANIVIAISKDIMGAVAVAQDSYTEACKYASSESDLKLYGCDSLPGKYDEETTCYASHPRTPSTLQLSQTIMDAVRDYANGYIDSKLVINKAAYSYKVIKGSGILWHEFVSFYVGLDQIINTHLTTKDANLYAEYVCGSVSTSCKTNPREWATKSIETSGLGGENHFIGIKVADIKSDSCTVTKLMVSSNTRLMPGWASSDINGYNRPTLTLPLQAGFLIEISGKSCSDYSAVGETSLKYKLGAVLFEHDNLRLPTELTVEIGDCGLSINDWAGT